MSPVVVLKQKTCWHDSCVLNIETEREIFQARVEVARRVRRKRFVLTYGGAWLRRCWRSARRPKPCYAASASATMSLSE
jgi:hypothetical protein